MISAVDPRLLSYVTCNATGEVTPSSPKLSKLTGWRKTG
jgi:hypothetical protein